MRRDYPENEETHYAVLHADCLEGKSHVIRAGLTKAEAILFFEQCDPLRPPSTWLAIRGTEFFDIKLASNINVPRGRAYS